MIEIGDIVISKAGHDEGRFYIVTAFKNQDFVLLSDGRYRKLDKPKTKRIKHVKKAGESVEIRKLLEKGGLTDAHVVHELKENRKKAD